MCTTKFICQKCPDEEEYLGEDGIYFGRYIAYLLILNESYKIYEL